MSITGLDVAKEIAIDRVRRSHETICIVQIDKNEYILWRYKTIDKLSEAFKHYKIVVKVGTNDT